MRFETQEARELHARIQTLDAIQSARGDKAKWLAEDRRKFWRKEAPVIGGLGLLGFIASIGFARLFGSDPLVGIILDLAFVTIVAVMRYPRS
ncbi:hypothetical protein [Burkholderia contaminans]|uniref:hypothetical protein n=1 Tax=Burkholderia contaminans TaxID=488447 RepID=UPI002D7E1A13|nr:hypothetical protein [Burkholderia contaminans]